MSDTTAEPLEPTPASEDPNPTVHDIAAGVASLPLTLNPQTNRIALVRLDRLVSLQVFPRVAKAVQGLLNPEARSEVLVSFWPRTDSKGFIAKSTCLVKLVQDDQPQNLVQVVGSLVKVDLEEGQDKGFLSVQITPAAAKIQPFLLTLRGQRKLLEGLQPNQRLRITGHVNEKLRLKATGIEVLENSSGE